MARLQEQRAKGIEEMDKINKLDEKVRGGATMREGMARPSKRSALFAPNPFLAQFASRTPPPPPSPPP